MTLEDVQTLHDGALMPTYGRFPVALESGRGATAVDVEGKASGIEVELVKLLAKNHQLPVTYAGGVGSFQDLETLRMAGKNRVDVTVGSALDLFGGSMKWEDVLDICQKSENYFEK